jgi:hypothetical protein
MSVLTEFPSDHAHRSVSSERFEAIHVLVNGIEQCAEAIAPADRDTAYFKRLCDRHYETLSQGVGVATLGRLLGASRNWVEYYRSYQPKRYSTGFHEAQLKLGTICQQLTYRLPHIATQSDLIAHGRELKSGALRIVK